MKLQAIRALGRLGWLAAWVASVAAGCTATRSVPGTELTRLAHRAERDAVVVDAEMLLRERVDPNTQIRFRNRRGEWTPWLRGRLLRVDGEGIYAADQEDYQGLLLGWRWADIEEAEVKNWKGGRTAAVVVGGTAGTVALAIVVVPLVLLGVYVKSMKNYDGPEPSRGSSDGGGSGARLASGLARAATSTDEDEPVEPEWAPYASDRNRSVPLFSQRARRRARARLLVSADAAADAVAPHTLLGGVAAGVRLHDMIELSAGVRHWTGRQDSAAGSPASEQHVLGFARAGFHFHIDAAHFVALPLAVELGRGNAVDGYVRMRWGLRLRLGQHAFVGADIMNPVYTSFVSSDEEARYGGWSWLSGMEAGATF